MKETDQNVISTVPEHAGSLGDDIPKDTKNMLGNMPFILPARREQRPDPFTALLGRTKIPGPALGASCDACPRDTAMRQVFR